MTKKTASLIHRHPSREKFWQSHLAAQSKSGLSQAEYCRRYQLSASAFSWWKRKLSAKPPTIFELVPVNIVDRQPERIVRQGAGIACLTIVTRVGHRIEVADDFRENTLGRLMRTLGEL